MAVVFAKQERSESDLCIQEDEIRKGAVLSDPDLACKYNRHVLLMIWLIYLFKASPIPSAMVGWA